MITRLMDLQEAQSNDDEFDYDEALKIAGSTGKYQYIVVFIGGLAAMTVVIEAQAMSVILPAAKCELNISISEQGLINSISYVGIVLSSHLWGFTTDLWGHIRTLRLSLFLSIIFSILSSFSLTSWMLLVSRLFVGVCSSGVKVSATAFMLDFVIQKDRPRYVTAISIITNFGTIIQSVFAIGLFSWNWQILFGEWIFRSWRLVILIGTSISMFAYAGLIFLPEGPKYDFIMGRNDTALSTLRKMFVINKHETKENFPVKKLKPSKLIGSNLSEAIGLKNKLHLIWQQTYPLFYQPNLGNFLVLSLLIFLLSAIGQGMTIWGSQILVYYTDYINQPLTVCQAIDVGYRNSSTLQQTHIDDIDTCEAVINNLAYTAMLILNSVKIFMGLIVILAIKRVGQTILLSSWILICFLAAIAILWTNNFYASTAFLILISTSVTNVFILVPICVDLFPIVFQGMALSLIFMIGRIGTVIGINIIGFMIYDICDAMFGVQSGLLFICMAFSYYILKKSQYFRNKSIIKTNDVEFQNSYSILNNK